MIEAGLKGNWGDISANLAVFDQEIKGFQSNIFTGSGFVLLNAGKQSTFGVEFEGLATIADALTLNLGVTYLDPVYDSFTVSAVGDLTGDAPGGHSRMDAWWSARSTSSRSATARSCRASRSCGRTRPS